MDPDATFYFGALSPYSWFAAERLAAMRAPIRWRPIFVGGLFRARNRIAWGLTADRPRKIEDCERRACELGLDPIVWPPKWPTSDLTVARAMTHAERLGRLEPFALAAMRECFRAGRELSEVDDLIAIARSLDLDFDAAVLRSAINSKPVKATLLMAHDEAMRAGVVGVPSITVAGRIFWGEDRLDEALAAAAA